jgi:exosortase E/protease (VPEID-CTERM system)
MIGSYWSPKLALDGFHTQAGWLSFTILGVLLVTVVEHFGIFKKRTDIRQLPALPFLLPLLTLFLLQIASAAFTDHFDFYYPVRAIILAGVLLAFRRAYGLILGRPTEASIGCGLAVYVLWLLLAPPSKGVDPSEYLSDGLLILWLSARVIGAVILIPLIEELAFRGFLLRRVQSRDFSEVPIGQLTVISVIVSSPAFGILHSDWIAGTVAGIAYAVVLRGKGNLSDAVVAHGVTNFCLAAQVLLTREWGYW